MALLPGCFTEDVLFNREACGVPGEKEEDIINHGLLKAGREKPGLGGMRTELKRRIFTPLSSLSPLLRELSWTSAQTHAEL